MVYIKTNLKRFSKYTFTALLYNLQPKKIYQKGNMVLFECEEEPYLSAWKGPFSKPNAPDLKNYQKIRYKKTENKNYILKKELYKK